MKRDKKVQVKKVNFSLKYGKRKNSKKWFKSSDMDPHCIYADPDPGQKITKFNSNHLLKVKKSVP